MTVKARGPLVFYIFAAIGLKLGLLLCIKELQFQFAFRCNSLIFARVTCLGLRRIEEFFSFLDFLAHLSWKLKWAFLITRCPASVCLAVRLSICLSVNFYIFDFFSKTAGPILTRLGTNHLWVKGIQVCSNILIDWLIIYCFTSHSRIFHLFGDVTLPVKGCKI